MQEFGICSVWYWAGAWRPTGSKGASLTGLRPWRAQLDPPLFPCSLWALTWLLQQNSQISYIRAQGSKSTCPPRQKVRDAIPSGLETSTASLSPLILLVKGLGHRPTSNGRDVEDFVSMFNRCLSSFSFYCDPKFLTLKIFGAKGFIFFKTCLWTLIIMIIIIIFQRSFGKWSWW